MESFRSGRRVRDWDGTRDTDRVVGSREDDWALGIKFLGVTDLSSGKGYNLMNPGGLKTE